MPPFLLWAGGGRILPAAEAQTVGQPHRNFREIQTGNRYFQKSRWECAAHHGGESCSRWIASGAISGKARGKMHHLGAGTVKTGGGVYAGLILVFFSILSARSN